MNSGILEIRTYRLKPGREGDFLKIYVDQCVPMLAAWPMDLVFYEISEVDPCSFVAMRSFDSLSNRESTEDAFYTSDQWRNGPREAILSMIEDFHDVTLIVNREAIEALRPKTR